MAEVRKLTKDLLKGFLPDMLQPKELVSTSLDDVTDIGCYTVTANNADTPTTGIYGILVHLNSGYYSAQILIGIFPIGLWYRIKTTTSDAWKDWQQP